MNDRMLEELAATIGIENVHTFKKDVEPHYLKKEQQFVDVDGTIPTVPKPLPTHVTKFVREYTGVMNATMDACLKRAIELEDAADELRQKADRISGWIGTLPTDIEESVRFEREARERQLTLALVKPSHE